MFAFWYTAFQTNSPVQHFKQMPLTTTTTNITEVTFILTNTPLPALNMVHATLLQYIL